VSLHLEGSAHGRPDRVVQLGLPWDIAPATPILLERDTSRHARPR